MEVTIKLREDFVGEPDYEWQVIRLDYFGGDWIVKRSESRWECVDWLSSEGGQEHDYTLKRVAGPQRGKLTLYARDLLRLIVDKHGRDQKINCIKAVRNITGLGLKEAKELVEDYLASF